MQVQSTKIDIPTFLVRTKKLNERGKSTIPEVIHEDLEIENDLEKIKIQWEMNSFDGKRAVDNIDKSK